MFLPRLVPSSAARGWPAALAVALLALGAGPALAEKGDRDQPMTIESNGSQPDLVNIGTHSAVFTGNVVITQGSLQIHADRVEISETPDGRRLGTAYGSPGNPARFRQKRDKPDEWSEGDAERIEYDSAANRVRFVGDAHLRMLRGSAVTDTASAALITYDTAADTVALNGRAAGTSAATPDGRTTVVFTPRASSAPAPKPLELPPAPASGASR